MPEEIHDFEDDSAFLSKEAVTRKRCRRLFNKRRDDFATDGEFDDYLEMVEDIIFNLVNNVDVEETKAQMERYRRENQESIGQNQAKKMDEDRLELERIGVEERARVARLEELRRQDDEIEKEKQRLRREEEAEELLRVAKGDEAVAKLRRKKEKLERKKRKKEAAAAKRAEENEKPDFKPMWFRPQFPSALPVPVDMSRITADQRPGESGGFEARSGKEQARAAGAAGFRQQLVYERAKREFEQSFAVLAQIEQVGGG